MCNPHILSCKIPVFPYNMFQSINSNSSRVRSRTEIGCLDKAIWNSEQGEYGQVYQVVINNQDFFNINIF